MSLFGNNQKSQGTGLFGNLSSQPNQGGGLFGNLSSQPNQGGGLFGNQGSQPNQGGGIFGNQGSQPNQGGGLFGNQGSQPNQGGGLFGNQSSQQNQGGGIFGNSSSQPNQGSGLFGKNPQSQNQGGGLFSNINQQNQSTGLFGNNQNNNRGGIFGNNGNNNLGNGNNNNQGGPFGNNNNNNPFNLNNNNGPQQIQENQFFTTITPVIALSPNNEIRNIQLYKLPENFQNAVLTLKLNLKNQELKLEELQIYSQRLINFIDQNSKSVEKLSEFNNFINQKLNKYDEIINQVKENYDNITQSFEEEQKNIKLMEQDAGYKIDIPSKFLINYSQNLLNRTELFQQRLNDIITLIKVYYSQNNNDFYFDSDIIESTIGEYIKIVKNLLEGNARQEKMINEMIQIMLKTANDYGYSPNEVYNNIIQYANEYQNKS